MAHGNLDSVASIYTIEQWRMRRAFGYMYDMHLMTWLIIFSGFVLAICLGLAQLVWDLSEMSAHASPHVYVTPPGGRNAPQI
jgi:hypothetical protein